MLRMMTILADVTAPVTSLGFATRTNAGYTEAELMRGRPGVSVR